MTTVATLQPRLPRSPLAVRRVPFEGIARTDWDRLLRASPTATPFSSWTFHRAWWSAYADTAEEHYLLVSEAQDGPERPAGRGPGLTGPPASRAALHAASGGARSGDARDSHAIRAIVPLMRRAGPDGSAALFMAASYHADYATLLAHPDDLPQVAAGVAAHLLAGPGPTRLDAAPSDRRDVLDLRRLREIDPARAALRQAFEAAAPSAGWQVREEREDVCPVVTLVADWETQLAGLSKKARHEIRRKLRRAERRGPVRLRHLPLERASVDHLIALHQARWGEAGLFNATEDGDRGRTFLHRLVELEAQEGAGARFHLADVQVGEQVVYALAGFDDGVTCYFYNAGMDPAARDLSPGVVGTAAYIRDRMAAGRLRFDFLRGNESYKYEWGAIDEPVYRLVVSPTSDEARSVGQERTAAQ